MIFLMMAIGQFITILIYKYYFFGNLYKTTNIVTLPEYLLHSVLH